MIAIADFRAGNLTGEKAFDHLGVETAVTSVGTGSGGDRIVLPGVILRHQKRSTIPDCESSSRALSRSSLPRHCVGMQWMLAERGGAGDFDWRVAGRVSRFPAAVNRRM